MAARAALAAACCTTRWALYISASWIIPSTMMKNGMKATRNST
ncbi:MAG: hypothetical protein R3A48_08270 [Polyangiales bacterium]